MKKQEIVWYSVKDDGMPTQEIIEKAKGRFLCSVKTAYLKDESITATNTVAAFIEKSEFVNTSFQRLNISLDACFIARVEAWAEMPIYE
mgnify:FL=1|jgi:hypothetical protein|nr:MAG TPA: hypothetical protein [Caudoviricetes sp.]